MEWSGPRQGQGHMAEMNKDEEKTGFGTTFKMSS